MDAREEFIEIQEFWSIYAVTKERVSEGLKKYSYEDFKTHMNIICHLSFKIFYFCYGVLQFFATWAGLVKIFNHDNIIIILASLILGFFPFIGTLSGLYGAYIAWGWGLAYSLFIFISPYFIVHGPLLLIAFFDIYKDSKRLRIKKQDIVIH